MGRKGESIFKRKDGRYEGRYIKEYKGNKAIYGYVYASTYNECKKKRTLLMNKSINVKKRNNTKRSNIELNNLIDKWLSNKRNIKESTYTRYYYLINEHIRNDIGNIRINRLNKELIDKFINNKLERLSTNTVYDIRLILIQIFKENNIDIKIQSVKKNISKGKCIYINEKDKIIDDLFKMYNNISIGILLSLFLGLRLSEVCGLKWNDFDFNNNIIYINRIISRVKSFDTRNKTKLVVSTPKSINSKRILPIPNKLINILLSLKSSDEYFILTNSNKCMDPRTLYNHYKKLLNKLNLNYTYHDLRHTFATNCIEVGIDYKSLMELLGHANVTTTMNIYVHPTLNNKRNYINKL